MGASSIELFDREAARYDAWFDSERGKALFESEVLCLRRLTDGLPRPWLEVGVGTGRFAEALGIDVGVDPAKASLRYAERRGIRALEGVGQALPFADGEFGAVFVIVTICFADDPGELLREAARVAGQLAPGSARARLKAGEEGGVVLGIVPAGSPWGGFYAEKGRAGHTFYSEARFFSLSELENLTETGGLRFERCVSTLFQRPGPGPFEVETPRKGRHDEAGFVAVLCRSQVRANGSVDVGRSAEDPSANEPEQLICMKDDVEIDRESPHCPYPSSRCRFREWCLVRETMRVEEEGRR